MIKIRWRELGSYLVLVGSALAISAVLFLQVQDSRAWNPVDMGGEGTGGGGSCGDTLTVAAVDTIGPVYVANCKAINFFAAWKGDSVDVRCETSADGSLWRLIPTLSATLQGNDDSLRVNFAKRYEAFADSDGVSSVLFAPYVRIRLMNMTAISAGIAADSNKVTAVWGNISCAD